MATRTASGSDHAPHWTGLEARGLNQRLDREERYSVVLTDDQGEHHWTLTPPSVNGFLLYDRQQRWRVEWTKAGSFRVMNRVR